MHEIGDLTLRVDGHTITVTNPHTGEQIIYTKEGPSLVAYDLLSEQRETYTASFLAKAWRAAHAEARKIGWLRS